ncbi:DNA-directed RNA polymerase III subunit, putative [Eimeria tenella]|uniref:DNA-directed RNA polymerase subunit n=1 Tax=Eimeria tenella TaxID=5802 RepID=U6KSF1_EIMTE|nr:DNA-directed RNA polymerase III subunit, putative [Eimeria tenella]CDJ41037.1 DNA-directed RNA polymerase III subunit, putative [Eimeria tenella]|eukprot:XP_013231787.1 DNA-directed RNA polymerase III subunit, putative [Eimeria tenella]
MALFCPTCHNMLLLRRDAEMEFYCRTCPYIYAIKKKVARKIILSPKKVDEPIGDDLQETGARIPAVCPSCSHHEAFFYQIQIRSSDEPMTTFYACTQCRFRWREN